MGAGSSTVAPLNTGVAAAATKFGMAVANLNSADTALLTPTQAVAMLQNIEDHCARSGTLFEDPSFPCTAKSITGAINASAELKAILPKVKWLRPKEYCQGGADLMVNGASFDDVKSGTFGSSDFHAGLAVLAASRRAAIDNLFIKGNETSHSGAYGVRFFINGKWQSVIVDDRMPCDPEKFLLFGSSAEPNEFWVQIVEKAYAKLQGCYLKLNEYSIDSIWPELTGGLAKIIQMKEFKKGGKEEKLWTQLTTSFAKNAFLAVSADESTRAANAKLGITAANAYGILEVTEALGNKLIRLKNPAGSFEWNGDWSDYSDLWSPELRAAVGPEKVVPLDDGAFWMGLKDFTKVFDVLYEVRDDHGVLPAVRQKGTWSTEHETAGGPDTLEGNPILMLQIPGIAPAKLPKAAKKPLGLEGGTDPKMKLVIILTQEMRKKGDYAGIGFDIVRVKDKIRDGAVLTSEVNASSVDYVLKWVAANGVYPDLKQVHFEADLLAGVTYFIIPKTSQAGVESSFLLRVYSEVPVVLRDFARITNIGTRLQCIHSNIHMQSAAGSWMNECKAACHPGSERKSPPPERTFAAAPRYKLTLNGKGKQWVWIELMVKMDMQKVEVQDPLANKRAHAVMFFSGADRGVVVKSPKSISIGAVTGTQEFKFKEIPDSDVTCKVEGTTYVYCEGEDDAAVRAFAASIRDKGAPQGDVREIKYIERRRGYADQTIFSKCLLFTGVGHGAVVNNGNLTMCVDNTSGAITLAIPSTVKVFTEVDEDFCIQLQGKVHPLSATVKALQKFGFIYPEWERPPPPPPAKPFQLPGTGMPTLEKVLHDHRLQGIVPVEEIPQMPSVAMFVEFLKKKNILFMDLEASHDDWKACDNLGTPEDDSLWMKVRLPKGEYSIVPVSGGPGKRGSPPADSGLYAINVYTNLEMVLDPTPTIDLSSIQQS